ncbi:hypothetical protein, partial [Actinomadura sp. CNU-125]|uniref:hypothetical protein n=1 Tax=Actinomadura sp. CNU-125 TaxID=1904961 RepID=UPI0021CCE74E
MAPSEVVAVPSCRACPLSPRATAARGGGDPQGARVGDGAALPVGVDDLHHDRRPGRAQPGPGGGVVVAVAQHLVQAARQAGR